MGATRIRTHRRRRGYRSFRGFTLIELLIVIAILLAIGGLVVVNLLPAKDQADIDLMRTQIDQFDNALSMFKLHMGRYPTDDEGLPALWNKDVLEDEEEAANWKGPYLENPSPRDRWGSEWVYRAEGEIRGEAFYDILSLGPDKEEGTDDDITNHDRFKDAEGEISEDFSEFTPSGGDAGGAPSGGGGGGG